MEKENDCPMCKGREWIVLQQNPLLREQDLVAPCLHCSSDKMLNDIEKNRNIKLVRDHNHHWMEVTVN